MDEQRLTELRRRYNCAEPGSDIRPMGNGIVLTCMDERARAELDAAVAAWETFYTDVHAQGHQSKDPVYLCLYWLYRHSGLVVAGHKQDVAELLAEVGRLQGILDSCRARWWHEQRERE